MSGKSITKLDSGFYTRTDVVKIAKELLGKILVSEINGKKTKGRIVETEAYRASDDKACHAYGYKKTIRTKTMFEEGGVAYVYLCYGIHHLFNVITSVKGEPEAVLIRALEPLEGIDVMMERRGLAQLEKRLTNGPGVLSKAMGLNYKIHNGMSLSSSEIWIENDGVDIPEKDIWASRRIGIDFAGECALWDWRFRIRNNPWVGKAKGKGE